MNEDKIIEEAIKYCSCIDFSNDKNLNEKGRKKVKEWSKQDFIAGAKWMQEQLRLSNVSNSLSDLDGKTVSVKFKVTKFKPNIVLDIDLANDC